MSMYTPDPVSGKVDLTQISGGKSGSSSIIDHAKPPEEPGEAAPLDPKKLDIGGKKEGITLGKIGNTIARGLAGAVGGPLYAASFLVGGALSAAIMLPTLAIAAPPALILGGLGALIGAAASGNKEGIKKGGLIGGAIGAALPAAIGSLAESALALPKAVIYNTTGRLGAGLCAFAATGKREKNQLKGEKFAVTDNERKKSTNEKLMDNLFIVTFPVITQSLAKTKGPTPYGENPLKPTKTVHDNLGDAF